MSKSLWQFLAGTVRFEIIGGQGERFLTLCAGQGIPVQEIVPTPTGFTATVPARYYRGMHRLARRCRCVLRVRRRRGAGFLMAWARRRRGIWAGLLLGALALAMLPGQVWSIRFVDFTQAQEEALRQQLYENGIYEGAFVDAKQLRRAADRIFVEEEQYCWVALNFTKGRLVAEKRDRRAAPAIEGSDITDLVAAGSGVITSVELEGGFLLKWPGQAVAEGDVLASGANVNELTGIVAYSRAAGKVYARMERTYTCTQPLQVEAQMPTARVANSYRLLAGPLCIPLTPRTREQGAWQETVTRRGLTVWGFALPVTVERTQLRAMETVRASLSPALAAQKARLQIYREVAREYPGYVLESCSETLDQTQQAVSVTMRLTLTADIARQVPHGSAGA